jgi:hypothetical protein
MSEKSRSLPVPSTPAEIRAFLDAARAVPKPASGRRGRLLFAMDATASREPTWDRACRIQGEMFEATKSLGGLEVQLAYFRGFDEFRATKWLASPSALVRSMTSVFCRSGHTQIEKVLRHAIAETKARKIDALVYVGDCMEEDVNRLAALAGELGLLGVPAFVFHEGDDPVARLAFQEIARLTKGAYCPFDSRSARQLAELLGAVAVFAAGGMAALRELALRGGEAVGRLAGQIGTLPRPR